MSNRKLEIKPLHLVLVGVLIIILGILIPSLIINAFSTIGFSIAIGLLILLAAYVFFSVNTIKSKGKKTIKWLMIPIVLLLLVVAGLFGNHLYKQHLNNKIYAVGENIEFPDFSLKVNKPSFSQVSLTVPKDKAAKYGGLDTAEDCSKYPEDNNMPQDKWDGNKWIMYDENDWEKDHPTRRYCKWRNDSRKSISSYIAKNVHMTLNYKLTAKNNVNSSKISISLMPDSGRTLSGKDTLFDYDALLSSRYAPPFNYEYHPFKETKLGNDINKGITRQGSIDADVRNSEHTLDLKVIYHMGGNDYTRLIRINR